MSSRTTPRCATCGKAAKMVPEGMEKPKDYFRVRLDGRGLMACDEHFQKGAATGLTPEQVKVQQKNVEEESTRFKAFTARLEAVERFINLAAEADGKIMGVENKLNHDVLPSLKALTEEYDKLVKVVEELKKKGKGGQG